MIGTLVGLIAILNQMGSGAKNLSAVIGGGMSLALVATLYGVFLARLVFIPAANKLYQKEETERFRNLMVVEGLIMLAEKNRPVICKTASTRSLSRRIISTSISNCVAPAPHGPPYERHTADSPQARRA